MQKIDKWKNQEALDLHHSSSAMEKILDLRNKYDLHMRVERYVSDEGERHIVLRFLPLVFTSYQ